jgi:hypothetical protein
VYEQKFLNTFLGAEAAVHDLKFKIVAELHKHLLERGYNEEKSNRGIRVEIATAEKGLTIKVIVYPKMVQVDIGCTFNPISWDADGALRLTLILVKTHETLLAASGHKADIPPIAEWVITHRHHGMDGKTEYSGQAFNITFEGLKGEMVRAYVKIMPDGRRVPRIEKIMTSKNTFQKEIESLLSEGAKPIIQPDMNGDFP